MTDAPDFENRLANVENQIHDLTQRIRATEQDATAARVLAGAADRDVTEIRGEIREFREQNTRVLNAMRDDLTDLRTEMRSKFDQVDQGFLEVRGKLDQTAAGQERIVALLNTIIERDNGDE